MKRILLFLFFLPLFVQAQWSIDPYAGLSFTRWKLERGGTGSFTENGTSPAYGFSWRSRSDKVLNWCGHFMFYNKTGHLRLIRTFGDVDDMQVDARYFTFAFTPEWHIHTDPVGIVISIGPFASGMIGGSMTGTTNATTALKDDPRGYFNRVDLGFMAGIGGHYAISEQVKILAQYRLLKGVGDMTTGISGTGRLITTEHEFSIGAAFLFGLEK